MSIFGRFFGKGGENGQPPPPVPLDKQWFKKKNFPEQVAPLLERPFSELSEADKRELLVAITEQNGFRPLTTLDHYVEGINKAIKQKDMDVSQDYVKRILLVTKDMLGILDQFEAVSVTNVERAQRADLFRVHRSKAADLYKENAEWINRAYKIHIQPEQDLIPAVYDRVLEAIQGDEILRDGIIGLKVISEDTKTEDFDQNRLPPFIVIYPKKCSSNEDPKEKLRILEMRLSEKLKDFDQHHSALPWKRAPRYSCNFRNSVLVYDAQGDGQLKGCLERMDLLHFYYDDSSNGAYVKERKK